MPDSIPWDGSSNNLLAKLSIPAGEQKLTFALDAFQEDTDFQLDSQETGTVSEATGSDRKQRIRFSVGHDWELDNPAVDSLESKLYWQQSDGLQSTSQQRQGYSFFSAPTGTPVLRVSDFEFNQQVKGLDMVARKLLEQGGVQHSLVYGINYEVLDTERPRQRTETSLLTGEQTSDIRVFPFAPVESFPNKTFPDTKATRMGIYLQDEMVLGSSGLTLIPALRYDAHKLDADATGVVDTSGFGGRLAPLDEGELSVQFRGTVPTARQPDPFIAVRGGLPPA